MTPRQNKLALRNNLTFDLDKYQVDTATVFAKIESDDWNEFRWHSRSSQEPVVGRWVREPCSVCDSVCEFTHWRRSTHRPLFCSFVWQHDFSPRRENPMVARIYAMHTGYFLFHQNLLTARDDSYKIFKFCSLTIEIHPVPRWVQGK